MTITGLMGGRGRILLTVLISVAWLAIVVFFRVRQALLTLLFTGIAHGLFAIILSAVVSSIRNGQPAGPLTDPFSIVAALVTNGLWGGSIGTIARAIQETMAGGDR